ncbi:MAG: DsrE/DsrF/DrsH-like family protein [Deltaproteobacteria bacterium]|nr:DsrE/DsrF/DrsH-like family protein [Deltaproteobacteria bacterium]
MSSQAKNNKTIIVFSSDLDRVLAAFNIAVGAASMGFEVTLYFTFWGLSVLRRKNLRVTGKSFIDRVFGWMLPVGTEALKLSKMNFLGIGTWMMKKIMKQRQVALLPELMHTAQESGVQFVACQMSLDMMGLKLEELIDGVKIGGVAAYLEAASASDLNLFV